MPSQISVKMTLRDVRDRTVTLLPGNQEKLWKCRGESALATGSDEIENGPGSKRKVRAFQCTFIGPSNHLALVGYSESRRARYIIMFRALSIGVHSFMVVIVISRQRAVLFHLFFRYSSPQYELGTETKDHPNGSDDLVSRLFCCVICWPFIATRTLYSVQFFFFFSVNQS